MSSCVKEKLEDDLVDTIMKYESKIYCYGIQQGGVPNIGGRYLLQVKVGSVPFFVTFFTGRLVSRLLLG